jgi:FkbM family methyltransferase
MSLLGEVSKVLYKTKACSFFFIKKYGFKLRFFPTKISKRLWVDSFEKKGVYEPVDKFYFDYLKPGFVVVDVGANIGYYTLLSREIVGEDGYVYSIEAHPKIFSYLKKNISLNKYKNISTYNLALGNKKGHIVFSNQKKDDLNCVSDDGCLVIPISTLDALAIDRGNINLLKIDVEGYEKFVMMGARSTLERTDTIFFESWKRHFDKYNYCLSDIFGLLEGYGFTYFVNKENRYIKIDETYSAEECVDIIATKNPEIFSGDKVVLSGEKG